MTQRFGTKTRREIGCSMPHSALWEGVKLVEITLRDLQHRREDFTCFTKVFSAQERWETGNGVSRSREHPAQVPPKPRNPQQPPSGLTCWQRRRPRGSEGRGCPQRRSAQRGLGCSCAVTARGKEKPELLPRQGGRAASTEHSLYKQAAFLVCPPHPAESCWNRLHAQSES